MEILASTASIFTQILAHKPPNLEIFSSQAPKFGNFQLTSPQIWKFSAHKPPFSEANVSSQAPHFGNPGRTPLPEKKLSAPPPPPGGKGHIQTVNRHSGPEVACLFIIKVVWISIRYSHIQKIVGSALDISLFLLSAPGVRHTVVAMAHDRKVWGHRVLNSASSIFSINEKITTAGVLLLGSFPSYANTFF